MLPKNNPYKNLFLGFYKLLLEAPKRVLWACLVIFLIFGFFALKLPIDANSDSLILENDKDFATFKSIIKNYKTQEFLFLAFSPKDENLFSQESINALKSIHSELEKIPQIDTILSILNAPLLKSTPQLDLQETLRQSPNLLSKNIDKNLAQQEILNHPFFKNNLIAKNGKTAGILVNLKDSQRLKELESLKSTAKTKEEKEIYQELILNEKEDIQHQTNATIAQLKDLQQQYKNLKIGGIPLIASDMIAYVKSDLVLYGGLLSIILAIMLWIFFRNLIFVYLTLGICLFSLVVSSGIFSAFGYHITVISSNYVSLLLIINVSLVVHLIVAYLEFSHRFKNATQKNLLYATLLAKQMPSFFAILTTMVGFLSLLFSNILPIIHLGIIMGLGVSVALVFSFILFASFLALFPRLQNSFKPKGEKFLQTCAKISLTYPKTIYLTALFCVCFSLYGMVNLKVENSFVNYFKDSSTIKQGLLKIDRELGGTVPLDILVTFKQTQDTDSFENDFEAEFSALEQSETYWFDSQKLRIANRVHSYLEKNPYIGSILSINSLVQLLNMLDITPNDFTIAFLYNNATPALKAQLFTPYANLDQNQLRFSVRTFDSDPSLERNAFLLKIHNDLQELLKDENVTLEINGAMVLYNNMLQSLISSQVDTLSLVIAIIFILFMLIFRSIKLAIIALVINLVPLGLIFGILGISGLPLDLMGVTIAAIALGIGVDDAIHYIHRFKIERLSHNTKEAILRAHHYIGSAMYYTTLIIVIGFCMMMTSNFIPTIYFGFLTTLVMLFMLLSALIFLPALLKSFYK